MATIPVDFAETDSEARVSKRTRPLLIGLILLAVARGHAIAQPSGGGTGSAVAGAALGAYAGATLGLIGGLLPCDRTSRARRCVIMTTSGGGAFALTMGGLIGSRDEDAVFRKWETAGIGALVGAGVGVVLRRAVRQYDWADALAVAAIGGAVGASPRGALIGASAGAAVGAVTWLLIPNTGVPDLVILTLAGLAVGGLFDWADKAAKAGEAKPITIVSFSIPFR